MSPPLAVSILNRDQLRALPEPQPLIRDTIDEGTVSVLAGYWGTYKSFIALDWAASLATGEPWMGRDIGDEPGASYSVLYIAAEGAWGINRRVEAWEADRGQKIPNQLDVLPRAVHLLDSTEVAELCDIVSSDYDVVFIDTLSKCIPGADENNAKDMSMAVTSLYRIQQATCGFERSRCSVIAVHHTGKDKTTIRGSSALEAGVDTVYLTEGDGQNLRLSRTKRKDGPLQDVLNLKFSEVPDVGSGVLVPSTPLLDSGRAERAVLAAMTEMFAETGASATDLMEVTGQSRTAFYRARSTLLRDGVIEVRGRRIHLTSPTPQWDSSSHLSQEVAAL